MLSALNTWAQVMATLIGIVFALYQALLYYSREGREKQQIKIARLSHELVRKILLWGALEDLLRPPELGGWTKPTTRIISFNIEGEWKKADICNIKQVFKDVISEFDKARKRMLEEARKIGFHPAMNALFNLTRFKLHSLFSLIYSEFPLPLGGIEDLKIENLENLADFEEKISLLLKWKEYFDDYFNAVVDIYYGLRYILAELNKIEMQSLNALFNELEKHSEVRERIATLSTLNEARETYRSYIEYEQAVREAFFNGFFEIKRVIDEIEDSIKLYNRYMRTGKPNLLLGITLFITFITGVLAPLIPQLLPELKILLNTKIVITLFATSLLSIVTAIILVLRQYKY